MLELYIGNKCFSSWSLRPWLALKHHGIPFTEKFVRLRQPDTPARSSRSRLRAAYRSCIMMDAEFGIRSQSSSTWPSFILKSRLWPDDQAARAMARSVSAEMHSGFVDVRSQWGMNLRRPKGHKPLSEAGQKQAARIEQIWRDCRAQFGAGGPFLFGSFTAADAMYAPVVTRFDTYGGELAPDTRAYVDTVLAMPAMKEWYAGAAAETLPRASAGRVRVCVTLSGGIRVGVGVTSQAPTPSPAPSWGRDFVRCALGECQQFIFPFGDTTSVVQARGRAVMLCDHALAILVWRLSCRYWVAFFFFCAAHMSAEPMGR